MVPRSSFNNIFFIFVTVSENSEELKTAAIRAELEQMLKKEVFATINRLELEVKYKDVLPIDSLMFTKCKFNANGTFNKWKARLAARGDQQESKIFQTETSSPTANMASINMLLDHGVQEEYDILISVVPGAFLLVDINEIVVLRLPRSSATI